jgi:hypothetical protein
MCFIFHITFVICHCLPRAFPAMANDKRKMENGKWKYLKIFASLLNSLKRKG